MSRQKIKKIQEKFSFLWFRTKVGCLNKTPSGLFGCEKHYLNYTFGVFDFMFPPTWQFSGNLFRQLDLVRIHKILNFVWNHLTGYFEIDWNFDEHVFRFRPSGLVREDTHPLTGGEIFPE